MSGTLSTGQSVPISAEVKVAVKVPPAPDGTSAPLAPAGAPAPGGAGIRCRAADAALSKDPRAAARGGRAHGHGNRGGRCGMPDALPRKAMPPTTRRDAPQRVRCSERGRLPRRPAPAGSALHRVRRKLASATGASIVFALGIFAVAAIICVSIVSIAQSSASNAINQAADEQDFLAASSAARLLQEIVPDHEVTFTGLNVNGTDDSADTGSSDGSDGDAPTCTVASGSGGAAPILQAMGDSLLPTGENGKRPPKTVKLSAGNGAPDDFPDVTVTVEPEQKLDSFNVTAVVTGQKGNTITVAFRGDAELDGDDVLGVSWEVESVGK